jgi:hypothetical protein
MADEPNPYTFFGAAFLLIALVVVVTGLAIDPLIYYVGPYFNQWHEYWNGES